MSVHCCNGDILLFVHNLYGRQYTVVCVIFKNVTKRPRRVISPRDVYYCVSFIFVERGTDWTYSSVYFLRAFIPEKTFFFLKL